MGTMNVGMKQMLVLQAVTQFLFLHLMVEINWLVLALLIECRLVFWSGLYMRCESVRPEAADLDISELCGLLARKMTPHVAMLSTAGFIRCVDALVRHVIDATLRNWLRS
jgi:hypothetical protein